MFIYIVGCNYYYYYYILTSLLSVNTVNDRDQVLFMYEP